MTNAQKQILVDLASDSHYILLKWFTQDFAMPAYAKDAPTLQERCKKLKVPHEIGCLVSYRLGELAGIIEALGEFGESYE